MSATPPAGPHAGRRTRWLRRLIVPAGSLGLLGVAGLAILWAATATPVGPGPLSPIGPAATRVMTLGDTVRQATTAAWTDVTGGPPGAEWFDLDVLLRTDADVDASYLAIDASLTADAAERSEPRRMLRARARRLADELRDAGVATAAAALAPPPGHAMAPAPLGTEVPITFSSKARELSRAARAMARIAVANDDVAEALHWVEAMRAVHEVLAAQPSHISQMVERTGRATADATLIEMAVDARGLADRTDRATAERLLDGLLAAADAQGPRPDADRLADILREEAEQFLRAYTDAGGRVLEAELYAGGPAAAPSRGRRIVRNLSGLFAPSRQTLLAAQDEPLRRLRELAGRPVPDPVPAGPSVEPMNFNWAMEAGELDTETWLARGPEDIARAHAMYLLDVASSRARHRGLRIAVAIERHRLQHGSSPRSLDVLGLPPAIMRDPWTGDPLTYVPGDPEAGDRWQLRARRRAFDGSENAMALHPEAFEPPAPPANPYP